LAALFIAWTWVPALISALGGTRYSCGGSDDTNGMDPSPNQPDYSFWAEQLLALGYEPLGAGWMQINFAGPEWSQRSIVRIFTNASKNSYAYMQKAPAPFNFWPGAIFATCLVDGGILLTDNNLTADPHPDDAFIRQGTVSLKLADVEALHLATQEALRQIGRKPDSDLSVDTLLHAAERHFGPEAKRIEGRSATQYLFAHGLIHLCVSIPPAYLMGVLHPYVALANLVLSLVMLIGESSQKRQYASAVRAALRLRQALPVEKRGRIQP
jgi:hypothetical protein